MKLSYHYLMLLNQSAFQKQVYEHLEHLDMSIGQPKILDFLLDEDGCIQKKIAIGCQIEPASVTSILAKMEKEEYVRREQEGGNRRSLYVYLTPKGKEAAYEVRRVMEEIEEKALKELSKEERELLLTLLKKANKGLLGSMFAGQ
ncbi:MAG: MarR family transcriptional regulator [Lachnospiraceae bacterium]|nr:MarR family transcriptional regulator [Lachnospiraceae bacterium]MDD3617710.1 MarR family transcriptional regulator [Lachnospiraceae bacterium]